MDGTILVADDDRTIRTVLTQALSRAGCRVHATSSLTTLLRWVAEGRGDVVISDVAMPDGDGLEMLPRISELRPGLPVIVISAQNTVMTAIRAREAAAFDYLPKPFDLPDLMKRVRRALSDSRARDAGHSSPAPEDEPAAGELPLVGRAPAMQRLYAELARALGSHLPVVVRGESGSGKSLVARILHDGSERRSRPLVRLVPGDLAAAGSAQRILAGARGGTVVAEEVTELPAEEQARLVHMFDLDGEAPVRFVATSRVRPAEALAAGRLREDLYYRLAGISLEVPALRDRLDDIALLAGHFLARAGTSSGRTRQLTPEALARLRAYAWPGNVRQLENLMAVLALGTSGAAITAREVEDALADAPRLDVQVPDDAERLAESVRRHLRRYFDLHEGALPPPGLHRRVLREVETPLIEIALSATGGNQLKCAELLGLNRNTLRKKIRELDISVARGRKLM